MSTLTIAVTKPSASLIRTCLEESTTLIEQTNQGAYIWLEYQETKKLPGLIAEVILDPLSLQWMQRMIQLQYGYFDQAEQQQILVHAHSELKKQTKRYYLPICQALNEHMSDSDHVAIEGFVRFRLKPYWAFLRDVLDQAVDAYLIDQEYQEFIKLLRYFVELQDPKIQLVNAVLTKAGGFKLYDHEGVEIRTQYLEGIILEIGNNELDFEDLLISALITVAPNQVVLHADKNHRATHTISSIFQQRVSVCPGCILCYTSDKEHTRRS